MKSFVDLLAPGRRRQTMNGGRVFPSPSLNFL
jgi:hypothetical protein